MEADYPGDGPPGDVEALLEAAAVGPIGVGLLLLRLMAEVDVAEGVIVCG
jgi:hypothetical protein